MNDVTVLARSLGLELAEWVPLGERTTYRVGGRARYGLVLADEDALARVTALIERVELAVVVLGAGSNMLVADAGFDGLLVELGASFAGLEVREGGAVEAGGAALLPVSARRLAASGLGGFAWAVGIPGTVGGAVRMNAGGHGGDTASVLRRARVAGLADGRIAWREAASLELGYRRSALGMHDVVLAAEFQLVLSDREHEETLIKEVVRWRREHQPGGQNAGSVFVNPPDVPAAKLIEEAGLKGRRLGSAQVSPKHANFIQADPGGRAEDVRALMELVRAEVARQFGVELRTEVRLVGFGPSTSCADVAHAAAGGA